MIRYVARDTIERRLERYATGYVNVRRAQPAMIKARLAQYVARA
jgi:hypothetical protein